MKRIHLLAIVFVLFSTSPLRAETPQEFWRGKVIFINQYAQEITAFVNGIPVRSPMPTLTGDAKYPTPQGIYRLERKDRKYWSNRYETWMPLSLFFIWNVNTRMAIHEGKVPKTKKEAAGRATHGCPHLGKENMKWLFDWAEEKTTKIIVYGDRSQN